MPDLTHDAPTDRRKLSRMPRLLQSEFDFLAAAYGALGTRPFSQDVDPRLTLHRAMSAGPVRSREVLVARGVDELGALLRSAAHTLRAAGREYDARCIERYADFILDVEQ